MLQFMSKMHERTKHVLDCNNNMTCQNIGYRHLHNLTRNSLAYKYFITSHCQVQMDLTLVVSNIINMKCL